MFKYRVTWSPSPKNPLILVAARPIGPRGHETFLTEEDFEPIQEWSNKAKCGRRISFDQFEFRNQDQVLMFLLRWA